MYEVTGITVNQYGSIASAANDGYVRVWNENTSLVSTLSHESAIYSLQWDPTGDYLLTLSSESVRIWDSQAALIQDFSQSNVQIFDAQWRTECEFVTCSSTGIWLWKLGESQARLLDSQHDIKKIQWEGERR